MARDAVQLGQDVFTQCRCHFEMMAADRQIHQCLLSSESCRTWPADGSPCSSGLRQDLTSTQAHYAPGPRVWTDCTAVRYRVRLIRLRGGARCLHGTPSQQWPPLAA